MKCSEVICPLSLARICISIWAKALVFISIAIRPINGTANDNVLNEIIPGFRNNYKIISPDILCRSALANGNNKVSKNRKRASARFPFFHPKCTKLEISSPDILFFA
jgi:hypothetical protein